MNRFGINFLASLAEKNENSSKYRQYVNLHVIHGEECQRLINVVGRNGYIQPHCHSLDLKIETRVALSGLFSLIQFDDHGAVREISYFAPRNI